MQDCKSEFAFFLSPGMLLSRYVKDVLNSLKYKMKTINHAHHRHIDLQNEVYILPAFQYQLNYLNHQEEEEEIQIPYSKKHLKQLLHENKVEPYAIKAFQYHNQRDMLLDRW